MERAGKTIEPSPIYVARVWKQGAATVFPLCKLACRLLGVTPGQKVLIRVHPPYVTFRLIDPDELIPVGGFTQAELPPAWPRRAPAPPISSTTP
jgi:hypothetical protein